MILLTRIFEVEIDHAFPEPMDRLDREFKEHLSFVFNQCLQALRKTGWTRTTLVTVGDLLRRLVVVFQAYKAQKTRYSPKEWMEQVSSLGKEFADALTIAATGL